jgi:D-lactate dehydrogenase
MIKVAFFSAKPYEQEAFLNDDLASKFDCHFFENKFNSKTAKLAEGFDAVSVFVNDKVDAEAIKVLKEHQVSIIATRSAGYNQIDIKAAKEHGMHSVRVPAYSPNAISEFTVGIMLTLGRKIHKAYNRVREGNFELTGLEGFELRDKTIGIIGTGRIGNSTLKNLSGFGAKLLAYDPFPNEEALKYAQYVQNVDELYRASDIISLHLPLSPDSLHLINAKSLEKMKDGVFIVNTSRGGLLDTKAIIKGLKSGKIGKLAIDVYEEEADIFYQDLSEKIISDDVFSRLLTFPNVMVTGHQAFLTDHALANIANTTLTNILTILETGKSHNEV